MRIRTRYGSFAVASAVVGLFAVSSASAGGFDWLHLKKKGDNCDTVEAPCAEGCQSGVCQSPTCGGHSGVCNSSSCRPPKWHSEEWYAMHANLPPGERPKCKHGVMQPVEPRPDLPEQPYWHKYYSVKNWPHPYDCVDRASVHATFQTMTDRGWIDVATLHPHHFEPQTQMLNASGIAKVNYVLTGLPPQHRAVYVSDANPQMTDARVANVRASLVDLAGGANVVPVLPRTADNPARPAIEVEKITRGRLDSMLSPVITYDQASTD